MTIKITLSVKDDKRVWEQILRNMAGANDRGVVTGIFKGDISEYAHHNEFGAPNANIKKRPFMRNAFDKNQESYAKMFSDMWQDVTGPTHTRVTGWLTRIGIKARNDIIQTISKGGFHKNAPSTIASKGSSKPLVDTGDMQRAITFFVGNIKKILSK